jgi:hypothetical protein
VPVPWPEGLKIPRGVLCAENHAIPDMTFTPHRLCLFRGAEPWMPCEGVSLVVEVTSAKPDRERKAKRHCYAAAGSPSTCSSTGTTAT